MKFVPNAITRKVARQVLTGKKHSPTILFVAGAVGVTTAAVLACRATLKVEDVLAATQENLQDAKGLLEEERDDYTDHDHKRDVAFIYTQSAMSLCKLYGPAVVLGVTSLGALAGSHRILTKRNAALTAAYALVEKGFKDYRSRVVEEFGVEKDQELRYGTETVTLVEDTDKGPKKVDVTRVAQGEPSIYAKFFDEYNRNWNRSAEYNRIFLQAQQQYYNDMLRARGHVFLNEVYDSLGMERTQAGAVVGWLLDPNNPTGDNRIDFGLFDGDREKVRDFVNGHEGSILLDFNVDGTIYDKI